jgi:hypothetical protein
MKGVEALNYFTIEGHITEKLARDYKKGALNDEYCCNMLCHNSECSACYNLLQKILLNSNSNNNFIIKNDWGAEYYLMKSHDKCSVMIDYVYDYLNRIISENACSLYIDHLRSCDKCQNMVIDKYFEMQKNEYKIFSANGELCQIVRELFDNYKKGWLSKKTMHFIEAHLFSPCCNNELLRGDIKYNKRFAVGGVKLMEA